MPKSNARPVRPGLRRAAGDHQLLLPARGLHPEELVATGQGARPRRARGHRPQHARRRRARAHGRQGDRPAPRPWRPPRSHGRGRGARPEPSRAFCACRPTAPPMAGSPRCSRSASAVPARGSASSISPMSSPTRRGRSCWRCPARAGTGAQTRGERERRPPASKPASTHARRRILAPGAAAPPLPRRQPRLSRRRPRPHRHSRRDRRGAAASPLVATSDVLYHTPDRRPLQDVLTCIREKTTLARRRAAARGQRRAPSEERRPRWRASSHGHEAALRPHRSRSPQACRFSLDELALRVSRRAGAAGHDAAVPSRGADLGRRARNAIPTASRERSRATLDHELALIGQLGYAPYFLTVHDIVRFARGAGHPLPGPRLGRQLGRLLLPRHHRGRTRPRSTCCSSASSRAERNEPPDIDVDFEHERREEVIQYIYAPLRPRAGRPRRHRHLLPRALGRARGRQGHRPVARTPSRALAGMVWGSRSSEAAARCRKRMCARPASIPPIRCSRRVLELASELIGFPRHLSQHVGGFVLTRGRLDEMVPIGNAAMEDRTGHRMGQGRPRRARHAQGRRAGARHARPASASAFDLLARPPRPPARRWPPCRARTRPSTTCSAGPTRSASSRSRAGRR